MFSILHLLFLQWPWWSFDPISSTMAKHSWHREMNVSATFALLTGLSWESNNYHGWGWGRNKLFLLVTVSLDVSWNNTVCSILCKTPSAVKCNAETELWGEKMSLCILTKGIHMKCSVWHPPRHYRWAFDGGRGETGRLWQYHFWSFCQMRQLRHRHLWLFRS